MRSMGLDVGRHCVIAGAALILALGTVAAIAQSKPSPQPRFTFQQVEQGFLRLDGETGQVSLCGRMASDYACRSVADDRQALVEEIERLKSENAHLRAVAQSPTTGRSTLPSEEEFDRALSFAERFMRRMMRNLKEDGGNPAPL